MILTTILGMIVKLIEVPTKVVDKIPSVAPTFGAAFEAIFQDPTSLLTTQFLIVVITFLFVDFFDTAGTLVAVANQAGLMKEDKLPRAGRALLSDSLATVTGAVFGTSTTTSYIESSAGVAAGARTGFASVVTGCTISLGAFLFAIITCHYI